MTASLLVLLCLAVLVVVGGLWLIATANRLDRLHVRTDAGWAALDAALSRRAVVARAVAAAAIGGDEGARLLSGAERAEHAGRADREEAENTLTLLLAGTVRTTLPAALADELSDAEHRVVIARRVHNDAVRDTFALRRRRKVRYFKLAGTAPQPQYFEIAEPDPGPHAETPGEPRLSARVLLVDRRDRVLLFNGHDPAAAGSSFWFTTGGGVEPGEDPRAAALRELHEETGLRLPDGRLQGPVWRRRVRWEFEGASYDGDEWFFLARVGGSPGAAGAVDLAVDTSGFTELELATIDGHRWWAPDELRTTTETVYPVQLGLLLPELLDSGWDGEVRAIR
ncbi:exopolyphosphatase [Amycolatopsis antarctica]|uniref:Exopolyphosphatase n=1 Tax=Amycolatopsis antarctica TaxID=1854586 RepID=A0A263D500_9PSEU|nr:NUDIX domain-containing protein [Amycolatopsis antarctica]OZM72455.1 exopolyphosphatase [Amycolatopsis antarctica]